MMIVHLQIHCVTLFRKIEHSKLMHFDISRYRTFDEGHPEKTYDFLITMIKGYIARGKQERLLKERERAVKMSLTSTKTTPALEDAEKPTAPVKTKKENEAAASSTSDPPKRPKAKAKSEAASVLPTPDTFSEISCRQEQQERQRWEGKIIFTR